VKRSPRIDFAFNHHAVIEVRERDRRERRYQARTTPKATAILPNEKCSDVFTRAHGLREGAKSGGEPAIAFCSLAGADSRGERHLENIGCVVEEVQHVLSERTRARDGGCGFIELACERRKSQNVRAQVVQKGARRSTLRLRLSAQVWDRALQSSIEHLGNTRVEGFERHHISSSFLAHEKIAGDGTVASNEQRSECAQVPIAPLRRACSKGGANCRSGSRSEPTVL
jgi:hypothetical protein